MCPCDDRLKKIEMRQVLCGTIPFCDLWGPLGVMMKVTKGGRPVKPESVTSLGFTGGLWETVEQCWLADPDD